MELKIKALVEQAQQGDAEAFGMLYRLFYPKMKGICIKILKDNKDAADDLVQDAFILALMSVKDLKNTRRFGQWLTSITTNLALKYQEKCQKVQFVSLSNREEDVEEEVEAECVSELSLSYEEVMAAIEKLPEGYGKVFKMSVLDGLSHQEIAQILNIAPHSSSSQLARARGMLRNILNIKVLSVLVLVWVGVYEYKLLINKEQVASESNTRLARKDTVRKVEKHKLTPTVGEPPAADLVSRHAEKTAANSMMLERNAGIASTSFDAIADSLDIKVRLAENITDGILLPDSIVAPHKAWENFIGEENGKKSNRWQFLAAGSLGTALIQNAYKLIVNQGSLVADPTTSYFSTWEEYAKHLRYTATEDAPETMAMKNIADHNSGKITETEHHRKPMTIGIAVNKEIGRRWSFETGLRYSFLKSKFVLGTGEYRVDKQQSLHYVGVPVKLSYRLAGDREMSAYGSAGVTVRIPVSGTIFADYITGGTASYSVRRKIAPPLLWTVNTNLGVQYRLTPRLSLFAEPTLNWHLSHESTTKNAWTERPFTFTLPVGLRFGW